MNELTPIEITPLAKPPRSDLRIAVTVGLSLLLHAAVLAFVLLPRGDAPTPAEPEAINVELIPSSEPSALDLSASSEPPPSALSSEEPVSEASSEAPAVDGESSQPPASGTPSSAEPSSAEASSASSAESSAEPSAESSAEPSAEPPPSEASSAPPPPPPSASPSEASSEPVAPVPQSRPLVIPVGPTAETSEPVSAVNDATSSEPDTSAEGGTVSEEVLATNGAEGDNGVAQGDVPPAPSPPALDMLHAAKRFYLAEMLDAPALANARDALKSLPPEKRLAQTCNIEAIAQAGHAGKGLSPDAIIANAFAQPVLAGTSYRVVNGAFRSGKKWYGIAYTCTLSDDLTAVKSFEFSIGADVTEVIVARTKGG